MKFAKDRTFPTPVGRAAAAARGLDGSGVGFLKKRVLGGALAEKKGAFLYVSNVQEDEEPVLWYVITRDADGLRQYALGVPTRAPQVKRRRQLRALTAAANFGAFNLQLYVGGGYLLTADYRHGIGWSDARPRQSFALLPRATDRASTTLVASLSEDNTPGAAVLFDDVLQDGAWLLPVAYGADTSAVGGATLFASGWDAARQAYRFGVHGLWYDPVANVAKRRFFVGGTDDRKLVEVASPFAEVDSSNWPLRWSSVNIQARQPAALHAVTVPRGPSRLTEGGSGTVITYLAYPAPLKALRSADHGATWAFTDLAELTPHLYRRRYTSEIVDYNYSHDDTCAAHVASPIGGGRMALALVCSKLFDHTHTPSEASDSTTGGEYAPMTTKWKFFVSDADGLNYVNKPWPLDDEHGIRWPWPPAFESAIDFKGWHLTNEQGWAVGASQLSAGPGSFFVPICRLESEAPPTAEQLRDAPMRMLWTADYGDTWQMSEPLPAELRTVGLEDGDRLGFPCVSFTVCRGITADDDGLLYAMVVRQGEGAVLWRTDARFSTFEKVRTLEADLQAAPLFELRANAQNAVFVGSRTIAASVRPGFPGFDKD